MQKVGYILELGLIDGAWLDVRETEVSKDSDGDGIADDVDSCPQIPGDDTSGCPQESTEETTISQDGDDITVGVLLVLCIVLVSVSNTHLTLPTIDSV